MAAAALARPLLFKKAVARGAAILELHGRVTHAGATVPSGEPFCQLVMENATNTIAAGVARLPPRLKSELALAEWRLFGLSRPGF